jgi:hypothetical protein
MSLAVSVTYGTLTFTFVPQALLRRALCSEVMNSTNFRSNVPQPHPVRIHLAM